MRYPGIASRTPTMILTKATLSTDWRMTKSHPSDVSR